MSFQGKYKVDTNDTEVVVKLGEGAYILSMDPGAALRLAVQLRQAAMVVLSLGGDSQNHAPAAPRPAKKTTP